MSLRKPGLVLRLHDAARPAVEQVGAIVGLQHRRQLRLERFVLEIFELDFDARVRGVVVGGDLVPQRFGGRDLVDVQDGDVGLGEGRSAAEREHAGGRERKGSERHGFLPEQANTLLVFIRYAN